MLKSLRQELTKQLVNRGWGFGWTILGQVAYFAGMATGVKLLTSFLGAWAFGILALSLTVAGIGNLLVYGPFAQAVLRFYTVYRGNGRLVEYFSTILWFQSASTVLFVVLTASLSTVVLLASGTEKAGLLLFSMILMISSGITIVWTAIQNAAGNHLVVASVQGAEAWLRVLFALAGIFLVGPTATVALAGYAIASLCVAMVLMVWGRGNIKELEGAQARCLETSSHDLIRRMRSYALPFTIFAAFGGVTSFGDRWMIKMCCGLIDVGVYAALYQVAYAPLVILSNAITQVFLPLVYVHAGGGGKAEQMRGARMAHGKVLAASGLCLLFWVVVTYVLGEPLMRLLTTPQFAQQHHLLWMVAMGGGIFYFGQFLIIQGLYELQPHRYIFPKALHACAFFVIAWWLLARGNGVYGIAVASILGSAVYVGAVMYANFSSARQVISPHHLGV